MITQRATEHDAARWQAFVRSHPSATVFHDWAWRQILEQAFGHETHFLMACEHHEVVGVLPLAFVSSPLFGKTLVSLPFCSWAGPLASNERALADLDRAASALADELRVDYLEYRYAGSGKFDRPSQDLYVCFTKDISSDSDANLLAIPRKQRAMIRKGIKNGLTSQIESVDSFFPLYVDNVHRHGTPGCPKQFFQLIQDGFGSDCEVLIVRDQAGRPVSGVLSLYFREEVFPFYAGDIPAARALAANDFKYWQVMQRGGERGATRFNYGRSKSGTGAYDFKKNWGFSPSPLTYEFRLANGVQTIPEKNPLNPKYQLLIRSWKRMPRWFVHAAGPRIVRALG